jgi:murein L,D-transpeptidase YcbB/YkuD
MLLFFPAAASAVPVRAGPDAQIVDAIRWRIENLEILNISGSEKVFAVHSVRQVYTGNDFLPFWDVPGETGEFLALIADAGKEGLNPEDYHLQELSRIGLAANMPADMQAAREILLTDAFLLYSSHLLSGKVDPVTIDADWHVVRREGDPVALFLSAADRKNFCGTIRELVPDNACYRDLRNALGKYRAIQEKGGWGEIEYGNVLSPGMRDRRVPEIRKRIRLTDEYFPGEPYDTSQLYDGNLEKAILDFQRRHGFPGDGKIDEPTIRIMNIPVEERIRQIEINLERGRWLPCGFSEYYLLVNIANFSLEVFENGEKVAAYNIVAGKPARKTPVFSSQVTYLVFNPTWTVPPTILREDVLPEVRKSDEFLRSRNIHVLDSKGNELDMDAVNWDDPSVSGFIYRQEPGPGNALGAVKFMFPNNFNIYLHDTPSKELFQRTERAFSSGCIRVQDPLKLAAYLLRGQDRWDEAAIRNIVAEKQTQTVVLERKPDIHILYMTCWVRDGILYFRKDIYERDERLYLELKERPGLDYG